MTDRHEFTAPDGSKRWCSGLLFALELASVEAVKVLHLTVGNELVPSTEWDRSFALRQLEPQPSGLRWELSDRGTWLLSIDDIWAGSIARWGNRRYAIWGPRVRFQQPGTLAECAHALKAAVTK